MTGTAGRCDLKQNNKTHHSQNRSSENQRLLYCSRGFADSRAGFVCTCVISIQRAARTQAGGVVRLSKSCISFQPDSKSRITFQSGCKSCVTFQSNGKSCIPFQSDVKNCIPFLSGSKSCIPFQSNSKLSCVTFQSDGKSCIPFLSDNKSCIPFQSNGNSCVTFQSDSKSCITFRSDGKSCITFQSDSKSGISFQSNTSNSKSCIPFQSDSKSGISFQSNSKSCIPFRSDSESCIIFQSPSVGRGPGRVSYLKAQNLASVNDEGINSLCFACLTARASRERASSDPRGALGWLRPCMRLSVHVFSSRLGVWEPLFLFSRAAVFCAGPLARLDVRRETRASVG